MTRKVTFGLLFVALVIYLWVFVSQTFLRVDTQIDLAAAAYLSLSIAALVVLLNGIINLYRFRLIEKLNSDDYWMARQVVEQLKARNWLYDGTLKRLNFRGVVLRSFDLDGAVIRGSNLEGACLNGASLINANLQDVDLEDAQLHRTNLSRANLSGATLHDADLTAAVLESADLRWVQMENAKLWEGNHRLANFESANLLGSSFKKSDLTGANLHKATLYEADLEDVNLFRANLAQSDLTSANLQGADLRQADLREAELHDVNLVEADLESANLRGAGMTNALLPDDNLRYANFEKADLRGAYLQGSDLEGANLKDVNLYAADLQRANLRGSTLQKVNAHHPKTSGLIIQVISWLVTAANWLVVKYKPKLVEEIGEGQDLTVGEMVAAMVDTHWLYDGTLHVRGLEDAALKGFFNSDKNIKNRTKRDQFVDILFLLLAVGIDRALDLYTWKLMKELMGSKFTQRLTGMHNLRISGDIPATNLGGACLNDADLQDASMQKAGFQNAQLRGANLSRANLRGARLDRADLRKAVLENADLRNAKLQGSNLTGANLQGVNFSQAVLTSAILKGSNLGQADLTYADLQGADLRQADLSEVVMNIREYGSSNSPTRLSGRRSIVSEEVSNKTRRTRSQRSRWRREIRRANPSPLQRRYIAGTELNGCIFDNDTVWPDGFPLETLFQLKESSGIMKIVELRSGALAQPIRAG